jgi:hypothetical protein
VCFGYYRCKFGALGASEMGIVVEQNWGDFEQVQKWICFFVFESASILMRAQHMMCFGIVDTLRSHFFAKIAITKIRVLEFSGLHHLCYKNYPDILFTWNNACECVD